MGRHARASERGEVLGRSEKEKSGDENNVDDYFFFPVASSPSSSSSSPPSTLSTFSELLFSARNRPSDTPQSTMTSPPGPKNISKDVIEALKGALSE